MSSKQTHTPPMDESESSGPSESSNIQTLLDFEPSSSSEPSSSTLAEKQCHNCKASEGSKELKPCNKCHTTLYCSRDCQKAGWKIHKKICPENAQKYALANPAKAASAPRLPKKDGHRGGLQKWQFDT